MNNLIKFTSIVFLNLSIWSCELKEVPILTTSEVTNITGTTASSGGIITDEGTSTVLTRGVCWSTGTTPTIEDNKTTDGAGAGTFISNITELDGATTYYVKSYAANSEGTGYGMTMSFTTLGQVPSASTLSATNISTTGATLRGTVNANYMSTVVTFEYGTTTSYGNTITPSQSPVTGHTNTYVSADITGLNTGTTYHFRIIAVNSLGTTYGNDLIFIPMLGDVDGNQYKTVTIGSQVWMAENLKTTKYSNGVVISSGIYVQSNDDIAIYGRLYTWYVMADSRKICPAGWHVPSQNEWLTLLSNVTSPATLKESGTAHWASPNTGATNSVLFTALPGGYYDGYVTTGINALASFWFTGEVDAITGKGFWLYYNNSPTAGDHVYTHKSTAFSVRCLKD